jgi:hypothetical protein
MVVLSIHAGSGAGNLIRSAPEGAMKVAASAAVAVLAAVALWHGGVTALQRVDKVRDIEAKAEQINSLITGAGGMDKLVGICGRMGINWTYSTTAAWRMHSTLGNISRRSRAPGIVIVLQGSRSKQQPMPPRGTTGQETIYSQGRWSVVLFKGKRQCPNTKSPA